MSKIFYHKFSKKYRHFSNFVILCLSKKFEQGGDIFFMTLNSLINIFFIFYIISVFITLYSIYTFFDIKLFHNLQGSKLKIKQNQNL